MREINFYDFDQELKKRGINRLSGEGCQMNLRWDTDVRPDVVPLVEEFFGGMRLTHDGYNGWTRDSDGNWHTGSHTWDYDNKCKRPGWVADSGKCFKLLRGDTTIYLLIFLILRLDDDAEVVIYCPGGKAHGVGYVNGVIFILSRSEYKEFLSGIKFGEVRDDELSHAEDAGRYIAKRKELYGFDWHPYFKNQAGSNRHGWSGKIIA